nr:1,3-beta-galactosyl-N-acetylhexosamine phosphorylase [Actinomyces sp.]
MESQLHTQSTADTGRLTLPIQTGMDDTVRTLMTRLGADAVRNSDGTELPDLVHELAAKVYSTYFVGRGDNAWADAHPDEATRVFLSSDRVVAESPEPLSIDLTAPWFSQQVVPDTSCDTTRWWQAYDRTLGQPLPSTAWSLEEDGHTVTIAEPTPGHAYTVSYLAAQVWDPTQMYNYLTNGWEADPTRVKEKPFDVRHQATWEHVRQHLATWLSDHPEVDVVRFTTFFYHFTLVYGADAKERFVDWFGYSASVSVPALEAFEAEYGYRLTPEDFVDAGYYNSSFRVPSRAFRDWISFQHRFVTSHVRELTDAVHAAGKEAMMFLGDNWIGTEPYGEHFADTGLDAVVGSVGSGATCRMIADIPHVRYTEGRFLPYFFPDVFHPGGNPVAEANESWLQARRAIVRSPLDRIGYGGYLSLAVEHPDFIDRVEEIVAEFRSIHTRSGGQRPLAAPFKVAVVNSWGRLRSWMTHMVAHALWYRQTYSYIGVLEALSGLPLDVEFLSFDDLRAGVPDDVGVLVNAGAPGTAFSGGQQWEDPALVAAVNTFVASGGGLVGVGSPSQYPHQGATFQLTDALGVDRELGWSLSTNRAMPLNPSHFITTDLTEPFDDGEGTSDVVVTGSRTQVLDAAHGQVRLAANRFGAGRAVYASGLPYSAQNSRLLHRALFWAAGAEDDFSRWAAADPRVEVATYPSGAVLVINNALEDVTTTVPTTSGTRTVTLPAGGHQWLSGDDA